MTLVEALAYLGTAAWAALLLVTAVRSTLRTEEALARLEDEAEKG